MVVKPVAAKPVAAKLYRLTLPLPQPYPLCRILTRRKYFPHPFNLQVIILLVPNTACLLGTKTRQTNIKTSIFAVKFFVLSGKLVGAALQWVNQLFKFDLRNNRIDDSSRTKTTSPKKTNSPPTSWFRAIADATTSNT